MYESIALMAYIPHNVCAHSNTLTHSIVSSWWFLILCLSLFSFVSFYFVSFFSPYRICSCCCCCCCCGRCLCCYCWFLLPHSVAVAVAFFLCWAPFHAQRLMAVYGKVFSPKSRIFMQTYTVLTYVSGVLYFMSTCINPLLYSIMSLKFRNAFKVIKNSNVNYK